MSSMYFIVDWFVFDVAEHNKLPAYTWKDDIKERERDVPNSKL